MTGLSACLLLGAAVAGANPASLEGADLELRLARFKRAVPQPQASVRSLKADKVWSVSQGDGVRVCVVAEAERASVIAGVIVSVAPAARVAVVPIADGRELVAAVVEAARDSRCELIQIRGLAPLAQSGAGRAVAFAEAMGALVVTDSDGGPAPDKALSVSATPATDASTWFGLDVSAAHVSGLAALYLSARPGSGPAEVREALKRATHGLSFDATKLFESAN